MPPVVEFVKFVNHSYVTAPVPPENWTVNGVAIAVPTHKFCEANGWTLMTAAGIIITSEVLVWMIAQDPVIPENVTEQ